ncbi:hypothetical protein GL4_0176 [Methyloceanibacter caenitepidi]|uniref:Uncharacterized protein n=1 Tax=Methyloceanibacter caenitepidi TaxID=1384459 RepID=A0A0A8JYZ7_9HYPH|nr:hypothetical protein GL4_0176 [Methyloceanibacter caenitepidi]
MFETAKQHVQPGSFMSAAAATLFFAAGRAPDQNNDLLEAGRPGFAIFSGQTSPAI